MIDVDLLKNEILKRLKPFNPEKIILFGSYAYGKPNEESDVDLYVVTNDDFMPKDYEEKNRVYMKISRAIRDIKEEFSIDMIVHTKKMYEKFIVLNSSPVAALETIQTLFKQHPEHKKSVELMIMTLVKLK